MTDRSKYYLIYDVDANEAHHKVCRGDFELREELLSLDYFNEGPCNYEIYKIGKQIHPKLKVSLGAK